MVNRLSLNCSLETNIFPLLDDQKGRLIAILRIINPTANMDVYYKLKQCKPQQQQKEVNFQVNFWHGRVRKKGHVDVTIAVEAGGADKQALVHSLCKCQFSLEMSEFVDNWRSVESISDSQQINKSSGSSLALKIELYCVTLKFFQHLQSTVTTGAGAEFNQSDAEGRMIECLQESSVLTHFLDNDEDRLFKEEKWIEVVAKGDEGVSCALAPFNTTIDQSEGDETLVKENSTAGKVKPNSRSIGSLVSSFLQMLVHIVRDLFVGGKQLVINVGRRLTLKSTSSPSDGGTNRKKKKSRVGGKLD